MNSEDVTNFPVENVSVVLPAGGCGERFGCQLPKQYSLLMDQPVILHTIKAFHRITWVKKVAVVVNKQFIAYMDQLVKDNGLDKVAVVEGCSTRHRSIYAGVKALTKDEDLSSVVIIHDAVRPFIDEEVVKKVAVYAKIYGAAGVTRPLVSTVIAADPDGLLKESLDRSRYCASEMPQGFQLHVIKTAYEMSTENDFDYGTECLLLAMKYVGTKAKLFTGPDNLWKVTYRKDLYAAEAVLKEKNITLKMNFVACQTNNNLKEAVMSECRSKKIEVEDSPTQESCVFNSVVFIYTDLKISAISENTQCVQTSLNTVHAKGTQLKPCVVHLYEGNTLEKEQTFKFMETISDIAEDHPDTLVYGILHFNGPDYTRLSDMITSLVWTRDTCMSGQTFTLHRKKEKKV